jgi:hypothetical protein
MSEALVQENSPVNDRETIPENVQLHSTILIK